MDFWFNYEPCPCIDKVRFRENPIELTKLFSQKQTISDLIEKIVIVSYLEETRICFNDARILVRRGITLICICGYRNLPYPFTINLFSDISSKLVPIPCSIDKTCAYTVVPRDHEPECKNNEIPTLKFWSHVSLYLKGHNSKSLNKLVHEKRAPACVLDSKPIVHGMRLKCDVTNLVHYYPYFAAHWMNSCDDPIPHLYETSDYYYPQQEGR
jgi:hypothetical protein